MGHRWTLSRLKTIWARQKNPGWGFDYEPAIRAVRGEAPSTSHALVLMARKIPGRGIHLLSEQEMFAAVLGLYHPDVVGLQEQRALMPNARPHPLHNFPGAIVGGLRELDGMLDVAVRLDCLKTLPKKWIRNQQTGTRALVIWPYVGDLLWAIRKTDGHYYCVNWSIKDSEMSFKRPVENGQGNGLVRNGVESVLQLQTRHKLECAYYESAGIRTVLLGADRIDRQVVSNLRFLFSHHRDEIGLSEFEQDDVLQRFQRCLEIGVTPADVIARLCGAGRYSIEDCRNVFFQGIWNRKLRVDLFSPILIDRPLRPESRDVLDVYADWFLEKV